MKKQSEVRECTFRPAINTGGSTGGEDAASLHKKQAFYDRLYEDSVKQRNKKLKSEIQATD